MATATVGYEVESIGMASGLVWQYLDEEGSVTLSQLARGLKTAAPRDLIMQGVGWLAREGKVVFVEGNRGKLIALD